MLCFEIEREIKNKKVAINNWLFFAHVPLFQVFIFLWRLKGIIFRSFWKLWRFLFIKGIYANSRIFSIFSGFKTILDRSYFWLHLSLMQVSGFYYQLNRGFSVPSNFLEYTHKIEEKWCIFSEFLNFPLRFKMRFVCTYSGLSKVVWAIFCLLWNDEFCLYFYKIKTYIIYWLHFLLF